MNKAIIGKKLGMTQVFLADGTMVPVTVIQAGPCAVTQKKTVERDGYEAIQLGFEEVAEKKLNKPEKGHLKASGAMVKYLHEFKLEGSSLEVRYFPGGRFRRYHRNEQRTRLYRRYKALESTQIKGNPRRGSRTQRSRFYGSYKQSFARYAGQKSSRSLRRRTGDGT